ncbi:MAG TPA: single-stranded DNA-binding protein [Halanaerobiales bacterium]|nr:single-stranded DNA-binding protein [Halanaerobiales bacterium]
MLNHIVLIGRLVRDPELRYTSNGTPVANFTLAVERNYRNQQGETEVDYIKIVTWRKLAENVAHHLGKGRLVAVEGSLQIRKSQGKNDNRTYINPEVIANNVKFLDWPSDNNKGKSSRSDYQKQEPEQEDNNMDDQDLSDDDFEVPF